MEHSNNHILQVDQLTITIHQRNVVNGVSFSLSAGKVLGIVGESGSGKSLTALSLVGLLPEVPSLSCSGSARFNTGVLKADVDLLSVRHKVLNAIRGNEIAMIFQDPLSSLNPTMTCGSQASEPLRHHFKMSRRAAKKIIIDWFYKVKLPDPERVYASFPHQLSGGQRQRVMIAMAMSTKPKILIADEPTTALDVTVQGEIIGLINQLRSESEMAVVFISHDLALVRSIADDIMVMKDGERVEFGSSRKVFESPESLYTRALMECRPKPGMNLHRLPTVDEVLHEKWFDRQHSQKIRQDFNDAETILDVRNLNVWYKAGRKNRKTAEVWIKANDDVSLMLRKGETLGIVGESGCGKSTLVRAILQLIKPVSGKVIYRDTDLTALSQRKLRPMRTGLQLVFQDPYASLTPTLSVKQALLEPMKQHGIFATKSERLDYIVHLLEKTGLSATDLGKYPHQFSGGQRQRIVIARALALKPEILFCDESVSALDVSVQAQVLNLLNDLKEEFGLTYVFISHDIHVIGYMSDRIMVMQKGVIVEEGLSEKIISSPMHPYSKTLVSAAPSML